MKKYLYTKAQFLSLLFALAGLVLTTSCEQEEPESDEVVLLSFGPSGVKHGDEIVLIGENLDKVSSIVFKPEVEVVNADFNDQSSGMIKVNVPQAAEAGIIVLKTPQGNIESKSLLNFEVPVIISDMTAEAKPGTNITITGEKINWIESVTFSSDVTVEKADFVSQSMTELVVQVPMEAQSGFVTFRTGGTEPLTFGYEDQLIVTLPTISSLSATAIRHTEELTITGTDLDLITSVIFNPDTVTEFVSHSETQIVVKVPATTKNGILTLIQASPVSVATSEELVIILPAATSVSPSPAVPGEDQMIITGENLDLVAEILLPGAGSIKDFITHSETEISFDIPAAATQGAIGYITIHGYEAALAGGLLKLPPTGDFPPLDYYIYNDGLQNGWQAYDGWGHVSQAYDNADNPANGDLAIKSVFNDAYGAVQIFNGSGNSAVFDGYNYLVFYVYVEGEDSDIIVQIGDNSDYYPASFVGDKYHQIVVPLAELEGSDNVNELRIKNNNGDADVNNTTVYIDEIGLTAEEPQALLPELIVVSYDDALADGLTPGGWGADITDFDNEENPRQGSKSIKVSFAGGYGGGGQIMGTQSLAGTTVFAFSIFGGAGTDGNQLNVNIKTDTDNPQLITIAEGKWTDVEIPISDFGDYTEISEIWFQDQGWAGDVYIDYVGFR